MPFCTATQRNSQVVKLAAYGVTVRITGTVIA
jgi:hypothetical protein